MTHWVGKDAFEDAMREIVAVVNTLRISNISAAILGDQYSFSYLLTIKQQNAIKKVCNDHAWAVPFCQGIEINAKTVDHILDSRLKEGVTSAFVADIMVAAYNQFAEIYVNKKNGEQAVFLNGIKKLPLNGSIWHGVAIVALDNERDGGKHIASVTAYHANDRKVRGIKTS